MRKNGKPNSFTNSTKQTGTNLIALKIWSVGEVQGDDQVALLTMHHLPAFQLNVKFLRSILGDVLKLNLKLAEALVLARIIVKHLDVKLFVFDILLMDTNPELLVPHRVEVPRDNLSFGRAATSAENDVRITLAANVCVLQIFCSLRVNH